MSLFRHPSWPSVDERCCEPNATWVYLRVTRVHVQPAASSNSPMDESKPSRLNDAHQPMQLLAAQC
jgi:hypothetical protein